MKLVSATVQGIGRFDREKINLAGQIVSIVGPNEAGKTSLLRGLSHLTSGEPLPAGLKSRKLVRADGKTEVTATYEIEGELPDATIGQLTDKPTHFEIGRVEDEPMSKTVVPRPAWSTSGIASALGFLRRATLTKLADIAREAAPPEGDEPASLEYQASMALHELEELLDLFALQPQFGSARMRTLAKSASLLFDLPGWEKHRGRMDEVSAWVTRPDPDVELTKLLWNRTPEFALFDDADRELKASYDFNSSLVDNVPNALANLLGLADLDLSDLLSAHTSSDAATRAKLLRKANKRLEARFQRTWNQATLAVQFDVQDDRLIILILEANDEVTVFDERSAGLRSFIALIAFVECGTFDVEPILLIDEAEQHLHLDAQAELVEMLESQQYASKVVYTTHSPGCLPTDLGTRVRVVEPVAHNSPQSRIRNQFWSKGGPGFSPLMMAMGAGAAAFTPARRALMAEGASEMILMPRLIREAVGVDVLAYQIAPGLSEAPKRIYPDLDLEASRVAFLVDGDAEGRTFRKNLVGAGFRDDVVFDSPAKNLEMLVDKDAYLKAANDAIQSCNPGNVAQIKTVPLESRAAALEKWCDTNELAAPSKVVVASFLADAVYPVLSQTFKNSLAELDSQVRVALKVAAPAPA